MKNLFKNLMLVAVAAMAFTACTETNDEVNAVVNKTRYEFTANIAEETRSGFAEKEEGATAYKSEWFGNETLKIFVTDYNTYNVETTASINEEGQFTLDLENAPESFFITAVSPAESWESEYTATIPAVQTPLANSVDPKAHLLQAQAVPVSGNSGDINFTHMAAYGKMTVKGVGFEIDHVVVDLKGSYYGYDREYSYTINADNVENNTFWFATEPIDVAEFTVTAFDAESNAVTKTVDVAEAGKTMSFLYGRVGTFSVSDLKAVVAPDTVMDSAKYYYDYNNYGGFGGWGYVVFEDEFLGTLVLNCTFASGLYLDICEYTGASNALGVRFDVGYSYYNVVGGTPYSLNNNYYNTMTVDVVDGKYSISLDVKNGNDEKLEATYVGDIEGLVYPDLRTQLETPNVTATAEGNVINISWEPVTGADYYYVFCNIGGLEHVTTTETSVSIEAAYNTHYQFLIRAEANDSNPDYRSSQDKYFDLTTDKDPNAFADVMATDIQWDSEGYFTLTAPGFSYINLEVNSANRPNNNSLVVGDYTYGKNENQFRVKYNNGYAFGYSDISNTSTMTVDFVDGQYVILLDVTSLYGGFVGTIGYKGMPEDWVAPSEGGESGGGEPVNPDPEPDNELGSELNPYTFTSVASNGFFLNFEGAENGASLQLDRQNSDVNQMSNYGGPFALNYTAIIYAGSGNIYNVNGTVYSYAQFAPYSTLEVTKADGNWTCKLKMSVDEGATYTYYTYTGQIANQAY